MSWTFKGFAMMMADANATQADVEVQNPDLFSATDVVTLIDDSSSETKTIQSITGFVLTMTANLSNSYTVAANGRVVHTTGVSLPLNPKKITMKAPTKLKEYSISQMLPLIISYGKKSKVLTVEGTIYQAGQTAAQMETNYLIPLTDLVHSGVNVTAPDTRYDGNHLLEMFSYEEKGGYVAQFVFKMQLRMGGKYVVI